MIIIFEADFKNGITLKPGKFKSFVLGNRFRRFWWLWFSVSWLRRVDLRSYHDSISNGLTIWKEK